MNFSFSLFIQNLEHPELKISEPDSFVNSFIMVVNEKLFSHSLDIKLHCMTK